MQGRVESDHLGIERTRLPYISNLREGEITLCLCRLVLKEHDTRSGKQSKALAFYGLRHCLDEAYLQLSLHKRVRRSVILVSAVYICFISCLEAGFCLDYVLIKLIEYDVDNNIYLLCKKSSHVDTRKF